MGGQLFGGGLFLREEVPVFEWFTEVPIGELVDSGGRQLLLLFFVHEFFEETCYVRLFSLAALEKDMVVVDHLFRVLENLGLLFG